jgi:methyltransferase (TIGR00027 family)
MNPISNTAFYCCGLRMLDAESKRPVCNDTYAKTFMDERGMEIFRRFGGELGPNASNVARHRYIDDWLRAKLVADPTLRVILIGCGFDSRAFRLKGGEWIELDEPSLIAYKNQKLPINSCPNKLQRIPIEFARDSLTEKLSAFAQSKPTVFVIEGVTMYLPADSLESTLKVLRQLFPQHEVIADLMTRRFLDTFGTNIKRIIAAMGADMIPLEDPASPFLHIGYRQLSTKSIILMTLSYRGVGFLSWLPRIVIPQGVRGYTIRVFT